MKIKIGINGMGRIGRMILRSIFEGNKKIEINIYEPETKAICSIEKFLSIRIPKSPVPKAVEKTISAVVKAFIDPIYLTP